MRIKRVVIAIYIDPDYYPPTINAILNLAESCDEVIVISRNNASKDFSYPGNIFLKKIGPLRSVREMEGEGTAAKAFYFLKFIILLFRYSIKSSCRLVVLYDHLALFAFYPLRWLLRKKKIWYHNHDMPIKELIRRYSIGGVAARYEEKGIQSVDYFSLPSKERLESYPGLRRSVFIIPNYPSLKVYKVDPVKDKTNQPIRIIYQGFIGAGHSLEQLMRAIGKSFASLEIELILKGSVSPDYKLHLERLAGEFGIQKSLQWIPVGPYEELPSLTTTCDIGIGINWNTDIVNRHQGTASNKIYEYAASGLPVILADTPEFRHYLGKYSWAFFSDGSAESLGKIIRDIQGRNSGLAFAARKSFKQELNFEKVFVSVMDKIMSGVTKKAEAA